MSDQTTEATFRCAEVLRDGRACGMPEDAAVHACREAMCELRHHAFVPHKSVVLGGRPCECGDHVVEQRPYFYEAIAWVQEAHPNASGGNRQRLIAAYEAGRAALAEAWLNA